MFENELDPLKDFPHVVWVDLRWRPNSLGQMAATGSWSLSRRLQEFSPGALVDGGTGWNKSILTYLHKAWALFD